MKPEELLEMLREVGALRSGHFLLSSGKHSDVYLEKFRALEHPALAASIGRALASKFESRSPEVVLSPAVGAIILGFTTAQALNVRFIFSERVDGRMKLRRGFSIGEGERVLVIEDVVTTGASVAETLDLVGEGTLVGIGCLADRSGGRSDELPIPLVSLLELVAPVWEPSECPLCESGTPIVSPGSRHIRAG